MAVAILVLGLMQSLPDMTHVCIKDAYVDADGQLTMNVHTRQGLALQVHDAVFVHNA